MIYILQTKLFIFNLNRYKNFTSPLDVYICYFLRRSTTLIDLLLESELAY